MDGWAWDWGIALGAFAAIAVPATVAMTMPVTSRGEYRFAQVCFILSGLFASLAVFLFLRASQVTIAQKLAVSAVSGALIFCAVTWGLDWLQGKRPAAISSAEAEPKNPPVSGNGNAVVGGNNSGTVIGTQNNNTTAKEPELPGAARGYPEVW